MIRPLFLVARMPLNLINKTSYHPTFVIDVLQQFCHFVLSDMILFVDN